MVAEFSSKLGSVEMLNMLFVLTCADISAVGPDILTPWKLQLLEDLFDRCTRILTGDGDFEPNKQIEQICHLVADQGSDPESQQWLREAARNLPNSYLLSHSPEELGKRILPLRNLEENKPECWIEFEEGSLIYRICIVNLDSRRSGNFYRLTGLLSSLGLKIRSADVKPLSGPVMFFSFQFEDSENAGRELPKWRRDEITKKAIEAIAGESKGPPKFRKKWGEEETRALQLSRPPISVKTNNRTVKHATIIDVFAYDKPGLLYQISKKIYRLGLDVTYARISTYAHQVIDVLYVTDDEGNKIRNQNQLQIIRTEILKAVTEFLEGADEPGSQAGAKTV
jgi:[protein-PII] uridylyltransferase